jgi:hypothetical protein
MMKIELLNPLPMDSKESIMWHNLKLADQTHNYNLVPSIALAWLSLNPEKNMQDFEVMLRENKFDTHLYTTPQRTPGDLKLRKNDTNAYQYECAFCCQKNALEEIIKIAGSYENNFELLKDAGMIFPGENERNDNKYERNTIQTLINCEKKIKIIPISTIDYILGVHNSHKQIHGKEPDHVILCKTKTGFPVVSMMCEGKQISEYGYILETNGNIELVRV